MRARMLSVRTMKWGNRASDWVWYRGPRFELVIVMSGWVEPQGTNNSTDGR